ncbi:PREDICTED: peroxisomal membrane protein 2 [Dinoponera quadriceps]|uniref:Peroxisomal membrane protein 2 n=1 Tax=Dinoponera quadriceps TaxID=609295 RepID=A0A6P3X716_DINQU|nr:PREDICTED: peroxisomal membrane protein 2 [Dinoponera quadriceps]
MALSKPTDFIYRFVGAYLERLYSNPLRTKAVTSCILASLANVLSQKLSGAKQINKDNVIAFALFGLFIGGPVPHYFYTYINLFVKNPLGLFLVERFIFMPCFQALALYTLALFEGKSHKEACKQMERMYLPTVMSNLRYLTLLQFLNIRYISPMLRVLVANCIAFLWSIYLANKRNKISKGKA